MNNFFSNLGGNYQPSIRYRRKLEEKDNSIQQYQNQQSSADKNNEKTYDPNYSPDKILGKLLEGIISKVTNSTTSYTKESENSGTGSFTPWNTDSGKSEDETPTIDFARPPVEEPPTTHIDPVIDKPKDETPIIDFARPPVEEPEVQVPANETPNVEEPEVQVPANETPDVEEPEVQVPANETPDVEEPEVQVPQTKSGSNEANILKEDLNGDGKYELINELDEHGNVIKRIFDYNQDGITDDTDTYTYKYDANGNIIEKTSDYRNDGKIDMLETYKYDENGNLLEEYRGHGKSNKTQNFFNQETTIKYTQDEKEKVINSNYDNNSDGKIDTTFSTIYDVNGNKTTKLSYDLDYDGNIDKIVTKKQGTNDIVNEYNKEGQLIKSTQANVVTNYSYLSDGTLSKEVKNEYLLGSSFEAENLRKITTTNYSSNGNKTSEIISQDFSHDGKMDMTLKYEKVKGEWLVTDADIKKEAICSENKELQDVIAVYDRSGEGIEFYHLDLSRDYWYTYQTKTLKPDGTLETTTTTNDLKSIQDGTANYTKDTYSGASYIHADITHNPNLTKSITTKGIDGALLYEINYSYTTSPAGTEYWNQWENIKYDENGNISYRKITTLRHDDEKNQNFVNGEKIDKNGDGNFEESWAYDAKTGGKTTLLDKNSDGIVDEKIAYEKTGNWTSLTTRSIDNDFDGIMDEVIITEKTNQRDKIISHDKDNDGIIDEIKETNSQGSITKIDTNDDGVFDVIKTYNNYTKKEVTKSDLDYDGKIDQEVISYLHNNGESYNTTTLKYDVNGNIIEKSTDANGDGKVNEVITYEYNSNGNVIKQITSTDADGDGITDKINTIEYNEKGYKAKETNVSDKDADGVMNYEEVITYDEDGNKISVTRKADKDGDGEIDLEQTINYDIYGNII